jgi:hypothetical protein
MLLLSKVQPSDVFIFHLYKAVILMFIDAAAVIESESASVDMHAKDSGYEDVHADEQILVDCLASA